MPVTRMQTGSNIELMRERMNVLLEKLPTNKAQQLPEFGDFLLSRQIAPQSKKRLGDRFAGVWKDSRTAEEIIAEIHHSRIDTSDRVEL